MSVSLEHTRPQRFSFTGEEVVTEIDLARVLGTQYALQADPPQSVRHDWFDTFDWRLDRVGLILERTITRGEGRGRLLLRDSAGELLGLAPSSPLATNRGRTALTLDDLVPAGPLRSHLATVVQVRSMLKFWGVSTHVRSFRALNHQAKTVARIVVETPAGRAVPTTAPPFLLSVVAIRGYDRQAELVAERIAKLSGLRLAPAGWLDFALAEGPRRPGAYTGQPSWQLAPEMPAGAVVRAILAGLLEVAETNVPGVIADTDTEFLHDLRVSVRRARTALKLLGDAIPEHRASRLQVDLQWLADLTTPTRDLDCHLLSVRGSGSRAATDEALAPFQAYLATQRRRAHRALVRGLRSTRWSEARLGWRTLAAAADYGAEEGKRYPVGLRPIGEIAPARIQRAFDRARRLGETITADSPATALHDLRKRCKELRYLLEFFFSLSNPEPFGRVLSQLKALQDSLGEYQDSQVQVAAIRSFAIEMLKEGGTPALTFMTMGSAVDRLESRQRRARAQFARRFRRFADRSTRASMAALFASPPPALGGTEPLPT